MARVKKILLWVVVAFVVYAVIKSPDQAAGVAKDGGSLLGDGVKSIGQFFDALLS